MKHIIKFTDLRKPRFQGFYLEIFDKASFPSAGCAQVFSALSLCETVSNY